MPPLILIPTCYLQKLVVEVYLSPIYAPFDYTWKIYNKNGRTLQLRGMRGKLELTVPLYIESSYLLASNTPMKRLAVQHSGS